MVGIRQFLAVPLLMCAVGLSGLASSGPMAQEQGKVAQTSDSHVRELGVQGLDLLMNGDPDGALEYFYQIRREDPQSPLGYILEADAMWWKIYYATGNLIDPDVFDVVSSPTTAYDSHFESLVHAAIEKARAHIATNHDVARNYLYEGMAYALQGRLVGLRGQDLPTARAGKKMRALLLKALQMDPQLTDAYLGVGIYNYFVDTLPTIVKLLRWLIGLPAGNRELGLQQLELAATKGELSRGEAKFYLAKDYSRSNERQYAKSLELFQELAREYPQNLLWTLMVGSLQLRLGHVAEGEALYHEVLRKTAGKDSDVMQSLHRAAHTALQRRHSGQKFE
jgi:tetratricopeptide (TPR) repeat protein